MPDSLVYLLLTPWPVFLSLFFFGTKLKKASGVIGLLGMSICFMTSFALFFSLENTLSLNYSWVDIPGFELSVSFSVSKGGVFFTGLISFISALVHLFSLAYMRNDKRKSLYFAYLSLFSGAMLCLALSGSLLTLFVFWELIGVSSFLLIGFWFEEKTNASAALKAFLFNRIGDAGFILAIVLSYSLFGTLNLSEIQSLSGTHSLEFWIGLGLLLAAAGKSAQFPLSVWLPDAMKGPTPVSALIHAATLVAAGIYLLYKTSFLFPPSLYPVIASVGALTALFGALGALQQFDIKKLLAYSTISQLGYMLTGVGSGATDAAMFHLFTHAFFKAGLFLSAGILIHETKKYLNTDEKKIPDAAQDMRRIRRLDIQKQSPLFFIAFAVLTAALAGLPLTSGFLSKGMITESAFAAAGEWGVAAYIIPATLMLTVFLTALYCGKMIFLLFFTKSERNETGNREVINQQINLRMLSPVLLLSGLSVWLIFSFSPLSGHESYLLNVFPKEGIFAPDKLSSSTVWILEGITLLLIVLGLLAGRNSVLKSNRAANILNPNQNHPFYFLDAFLSVSVLNALRNTAYYLAAFDKKFVDGLVNAIAKAKVVLGVFSAWCDKYLIDGLVNLLVWLTGQAGQILRNLQGGRLQAYLAFAFLGILLLLFSVLSVL